MNEDSFVFFWGVNGPYGCFSNWYYSPIVDDRNNYNCVEQYMMYYKAIISSDFETAQKIIEEQDPRKQKALGRKVKNFNQNKWDNFKYKIVLNGVYLKCIQNQEIKHKLLDTENKIIVEASPYDEIWGIGFKEENALENIDDWGQNLLGKCLMEVRENLNG